MRFLYLGFTIRSIIWAHGRVPSRFSTSHTNDFQIHTLSCTTSDFWIAKIRFIGKERAYYTYKWKEALDQEREIRYRRQLRSRLRTRIYDGRGRRVMGQKTPPKAVPRLTLIIRTAPEMTVMPSVVKYRSTVQRVSWKLDPASLAKGVLSWVADIKEVIFIPNHRFNRRSGREGRPH